MSLNLKRTFSDLYYQIPPEQSNIKKYFKSSDPKTIPYESKLYPNASKKTLFLFKVPACIKNTSREIFFESLGILPDSIFLIEEYLDCQEYYLRTWSEKKLENGEDDFDCYYEDWYDGLYDIIIDFFFNSTFLYFTYFPKFIPQSKNTWSCILFTSTKGCQYCNCFKIGLKNEFEEKNKFYAQSDLCYICPDQKDKKNKKCFCTANNNIFHVCKYLWNSFDIRERIETWFEYTNGYTRSIRFLDDFIDEKHLTVNFE
jgi:hypothetical protein